MIKELFRTGLTPKELLRNLQPNRQLRSCLCTQEQLESPRFQHWTTELKETPGRLHRKLWEYCFIAEALEERDLLRHGTRGLGFAVGTEPLAAVFASRGVDVVGSDMDPDEALAQGWIDTNQHASGLAAMNQRGICPPDLFEKHCSFRAVDMNNIPSDLNGFDFCWSACAFEHLGSLQHGINFVLRSMDTLKPGGVAVHTTEYNTTSNDETLAQGGTVFFRRRDIDDLVTKLRRAGHKLRIDFSEGNGPADKYVDQPPYKSDVHLKLMNDKYVITSIGLIITKAL